MTSSSTWTRLSQFRKSSFTNSIMMVSCSDDDDANRTFCIWAYTGTWWLCRSCRQSTFNRHLCNSPTGCLMTSTTASPTWSTTLSRRGSTAGCGHPAHGRHTVHPSEPTTTSKGGTTGWISVADTATLTYISWRLFCTPRRSSWQYKLYLSPNGACFDISGGRCGSCRAVSPRTGISMRLACWRRQVFWKSAPTSTALLTDCRIS